ncbi:uncharacterized protein [Anoplolepis gracilipes]|uniref:uncharacterized protein n=1 Tax=Anoplolepis gracilipes TaxID=354296 RepID=UPI003BA1EB4F
MTLVAIEKVIEEKRHHLVLHGSAVSETFKRSGVDKDLFNLCHLSYLSITRTCLQSVPEEIGELTNLTTLLLNSNEISVLPSSIGKLINLKVFDCSKNKLTSCPKELGNLSQLKMLNLSSNLLEDIPSQYANVALRVLNLGNNKLKTFADVCSLRFLFLSELYLNNNEIREIPTTISKLPSLKVLNLDFNLLIDLPKELANCDKLENLNLQRNQMYCPTLRDLCASVNKREKIFNHLTTHHPLPLNVIDKFKVRTKNYNMLSSKDSNYIIRDLISKNLVKIEGVTHDSVIKVTKYVDHVRPFIAACVVRNIKFTDKSFKKFTKLHIRLNNEVCDNKATATIMTHDMQFIVPGYLTYTAKPPMELLIEPFPRDIMCTGKFLFKELQAEVENVCKITKQNECPKRYKYLNSLEGKSLFPCLLDHKRCVISFPPIVNSNSTKVSQSTQTILVEVTSATSDSICRNILHQFLTEFLISNFTNPILTKNQCPIVINQVRVEDTDGNQKLIYPLIENFN